MPGGAYSASNHAENAPARRGVAILGSGVPPYPRFGGGFSMAIGSEKNEQPDGDRRQEGAESNHRKIERGHVRCSSLLVHRLAQP